MTWQIDGHELYLAMVFPDGRTGSGYRGNQVSVGEVDGVEQWRPADDVVAFAVTCECSIGETWRTEPTVLARWERVRSADLEDLGGGRLFALDVEEMFTVDDRDDVAERMLALWALHREPQERTAALEQAWSRHRQALADVDDAVRAARVAGLSWVDVGRATGMTRQSARERWGTP